MATSTNDKVIEMRCKAFSTEGVRNNLVLVEPDGSVRVWDDVAGYYTTCHALGEASKRRARKMARESA